MFTDKSSWLKNGLRWIRPTHSEGKKKKKDSINENVSVVLGREWTYIQCNQCCRLVVLVVVAGGFPGGETWLSSLEITCSHQLLRRNIKIHLDITQVFYHALSDPILPYHTLHTLKHGYPFLDTLLTFKCKRWKRQGCILHEVEEIRQSRRVQSLELEFAFFFHFLKTVTQT